MADFERPLANNSRTCNTSSPLYIPSPPLGRVWRRRSSEVGIFHSGDFAEYVSGGFVHFSSGDDTGRPAPAALAWAAVGETRRCPSARERTARKSRSRSSSGFEWPPKAESRTLAPRQ